MNKHFGKTGIMVLTFAALAGCAAVETATTVATTVGQATGTISKEQGQAIRKSTAAVSKSLEDFTPEQEYYIGRTVGAVVMGKY